MIGETGNDTGRGSDVSVQHGMVMITNLSFITIICKHTSMIIMCELRMRTAPVSSLVQC